MLYICFFYIFFLFLLSYHSSQKLKNTALTSCLSAPEEAFANLTPDMLLFRACEVHNLPMMSHSLALGANKNWHNADERGRTPMHQAVKSVSAYLLFK